MGDRFVKGGFFMDNKGKKRTTMKIEFLLQNPVSFCELLCYDT